MEGSARDPSSLPWATAAVWLHGLSEAVMVTDPAETIRYVNPAFCALTGYQAVDVLGRTPRFLQGPETDANTRAQVRAAVDQGQAIRVQLLNYRGDGRRFWNDLSISPVYTSDGVLTAFLSVQRDVTEDRAAAVQKDAVRRGWQAVAVATTALTTTDGDPDAVIGAAVQQWAAAAGAVAVLLARWEQAQWRVIAAAGEDRPEGLGAVWPEGPPPGLTVRVGERPPGTAWNPGGPPIEGPVWIGSWAPEEDTGWALWVRWPDSLRASVETVPLLEQFLRVLADRWRAWTTRRERQRAHRYRQVYQDVLDGLVRAATPEAVWEALGGPLAADPDVRRVTIAGPGTPGRSVVPRRPSGVPGWRWSVTLPAAERRVDRTRRTWTIPGPRPVVRLTVEPAGAWPPGLAPLVGDAVQATGLAWARVTESRETERLRRFQAAALGALQEFLTGADPPTVFDALVRRLVTDAGCVVAYVVAPGPTPGVLDRVAWAPHAPPWEELVMALHPVTDPAQGPAARLLASQAWQTRRPCGPVRPVEDEHLRALVRQNPLWRAVQAVMAWPILNPDGTPRAVLSVWATERDHFTTAVRQLLAQLVESVQWALQRLEWQRELAEWAWTDPLTGLANRRALEAYVEAAWDRLRAAHTTLALAVVDLDDFKSLNDQWGHAYGDRVLRALAERLKHAVRAADCVARLGGDEFVVCAELRRPQEWAALADRLRHALAMPLPAPGHGRIQASLGVAFAPKDGQRPSDVFRQADAACYRAKRRQRGRARGAADPNGPGNPPAPGGAATGGADA